MKINCEKLNSIPTCTTKLFLSRRHQIVHPYVRHSGSLRFSQFSGCWTDFVCLYTYEFWLSLCKIVRSSVIVLLSLFNEYSNSWIQLLLTWENCPNAAVFHIKFIKIICQYDFISVFCRFLHKTIKTKNEIKYENKF
jgi:hypothetical protein